MTFSGAAVTESKEDADVDSLTSNGATPSFLLVSAALAGFAELAKVPATASIGGGGGGVTAARLHDLVKSAQEHEDNKRRLDVEFGGLLQLAANLNTDLVRGLKSSQVPEMRQNFGCNVFPEAPMKGFCQLFAEAFNDTILIVLIAAAFVSLVVGSIEEPAHGWIEGLAILIAVLIVASVTAGNDYSKELQFRALEKTSEDAERCVVLRDGVTQQVSPDDLVVGDVVVLKAGDGIPADGIIFAGDGVKSNESGLTGEPDDLDKRPDGDPFMFSSCTITELGRSADCRMMVNAVGEHSQWGKIKADLVKPPSETPLQQKLDEMVKIIGYIGVAFAIATFTVLIISIWTREGGQDVAQHMIEAFIISVTIIVVAIPEGLPLAVTISLAYSTRKMYADMNLIRVLAACETMGNATNICSDKTGTLTENQMTIVEGWFCDKKLTPADIRVVSSLSNPAVDIITQHVAVNRSVDVKFTDPEGNKLHKPKVIGNATEGSLVLLLSEWGFDVVSMKKAMFDPAIDVEYPFDSKKKRSSTLVHRKDVGKDGQYRLFLKGASEDILALCQHYTSADGTPRLMTSEKRKELEDVIFDMANRALRTLCIGHRDYASEKDLPENWREAGPAPTDLVCDAIVGIMDPLRGDVKDAVATAQRAGVTVRMVTGDNVDTARAIARDCGIYDPDHGIAMTGPDFRVLTPAQLDEVLPKLQVLARSTPKDKYLLVTRLNGNGLPKNEREWLDYHDKDGVRGLSWERDRDRLLPGHAAEWNAARPRGGEVVGVTGDGTNDAPALKAADVGLSMGITGTKVAQNASDIVILDDRFSSIVKAIMWGRAVYDNIRKFLQFQLTVNVVALLIVFIGSAAGFDPPLNAVMMLWVNLIMDTLGALALGTESPTPALLDRRPYARDATLVSRPMFRNILCQATFQMALLLFLLFGSEMLFVGVGTNNPCKKWVAKGSSTQTWDLNGDKASSGTGPISCDTFVDGYDVSSVAVVEPCSGSEDNRVCVDDNFDQFDGFTDDCLECDRDDYTHYSIIFNAFVWCQVFNEFNARNILDDWNILKGITKNTTFAGVMLITTGLQVFMIEVGGEFVKTAHLTAYQWGVTIGLAALALPVGVFMRFIPVKENPKYFAGTEFVTRTLVGDHRA